MEYQGVQFVVLRAVAEEDLPIFFEQQLDPVANHMAAFTSVDPADRAAFDHRWRRILADPTLVRKTVLCEGRVAGSILCHTWFGEREVCYWLGREFWGRGVASRALAEFLNAVEARPLFARVARDNVASLRVLQKCGFVITGEERGFANARGEEVEELVLELKTR